MHDAGAACVRARDEVDASGLRQTDVFGVAVEEGGGCRSCWRPARASSGRATGNEPATRSEPRPRLSPAMTSIISDVMEEAVLDGIDAWWRLRPTDPRGPLQWGRSSCRAHAAAPTIARNSPVELRRALSPAPTKVDDARQDDLDVSAVAIPATMARRRPLAPMSPP